MSRRRELLEYIESFWARVDTSGDCWLWTGEVNNKDYGVFKVYEGGGREKMLAHRFSALMSGLPVRVPSDVVMHECDTPRCVRPSHLSVGSQQDNLQDAKRKNRIDLGGLTSPVVHNCKDCGEEFMGAPNERYCDTHKAEKRWSA